MPANKIYKFKDINEMQYFLNGAIVGKDIGAGVEGLVGKTLTFGAPAGAVTFVAGTDPVNPYLLRLKDIKAQTEASIATLKVISMDGRIAFIEATPTTGVSLSAGDDNILLGFDKAAATVGKLYKPAGIAGAAAPQWPWAYSVNENMHLVFTWE